jgi:hypothetical protein
MSLLNPSRSEVNSHSTSPFADEKCRCRDFASLICLLGVRIHPTICNLRSTLHHSPQHRSTVDTMDTTTIYIPLSFFVCFFLILFFFNFFLKFLISRPVVRPGTLNFVHPGGLANHHFKKHFLIIICYRFKLLLS